MIGNPKWGDPFGFVDRKWGSIFMSAVLFLLEASLRMIPGSLLFLFTFQNHLRYGKKNTSKIVGIILLITISLPMTCFLLFGQSAWIRLYIVVYLILMVLLCLFLIDFSFYRILLVLFTIIYFINNISLIKDCFGQFAQSLIVAWGYFPTSCFLRFWVTVCVFPLMFLFCHYLLRPLVDQPNDSPFYHSLWSIPFMFIIVYALVINPQDHRYVYYYFNYVSIQKAITWVIGTNAAFSLVLLMLKQTIAQLHVKEKLASSNLHNTIQLKMYENLLQQMKESRRSRHDFRHHVLMMKNFCEQQDYTGMQTYLNHYLDSVSFEDDQYYCDNAMINSILQYYHELCHQHQIQMELDIRLPRNLKIMDTDACALLSNAIENAVEACMRIHDQDVQRWIKVQMHTFEDRTYTLILENAYRGDIIRNEDGSLISSKHEGEGMGIASIQSIVQKYQGVCKIAYDGQVFSLKVMLISPNESS